MRREDSRSVLIVGGAGFIGSNWASRLLETTKAPVHIFDNLSRPGSQHNLEFLQKMARGSGRLKITIADVRERTSVAKAMKEATEVYHFAAQVAVTTSLADPRTDFEINVGGTLNILEAARENGHRPFLLFTSTNKVYGNLASRKVLRQRKRYVTPNGKGTNEDQPLDFHSPYGCSKGAADQYVHDFARIFGLPTVVFRMSCIAGPHQFGNEDQGWIAHFLYSAMLKNRVRIYGSGRQVRDVLYIEDLLRAFEVVREHEAVTAGQVFNVGGGSANSISLLELIELIEEVTGTQIEPESDRPRVGDQPIYVTDYSKLNRMTGWKPTTNIRRILEQILAWFSRNRDLIESVHRAVPTVVGHSAANSTIHCRAA